MYSVYLLDDEPFILEGLKYILPWEEYGFKIVGTASNGIDGFEEIINSNIDLIITDINMPNMTGLELIKSLRERNYITNFIVLSAFQEFEYARKAIKMGAENYLLKPIDTDELSNTLKKIYDDLKKKEKSKLDQTIINNAILLKIIKDKDYTNKKQKLSDIGVDITNKKNKVIIIELKDKSKDINKLINQWDEIKYYIHCKENKSKAILITNQNEDELLIEDLTDLKNMLEKNTTNNVYISIGKQVVDIKDLYISYESAINVSEYKMVNSDVSWIKEYKEGYKDTVINYINFNELKKLLMNKSFSELSVIVNDIFSQLKYDDNLSPNQIKIKALEVFLNIYNYFNESKMMKGLNIYLENVINNSTVDKIQIELLNMIKYMKSKLEHTQESISPVILKLLKHIEENYKIDLNLREISDKLNINPIYLGQLFQKEMGILFSDYLNNFRINKAKDLLANTSLKASEIGELVGYSNKNYFYRKFKTIVGITPSEWRRINL